MRIFALTALCALSLDQASKWVIVFYMGLERKLAIDVFPPFLNFRMGWNTGINFGLLSDYPDTMRWILVGLTVVISIGLLVWGRRTFSSSAEWISAGLIVGGALGNAMDRVFYKAVADFLNMSCCGINNPFTFNVADIFIFLGAVGLILFSTSNKTA